MKKLIYIFLLLPIIALAQNKLTVSVEGVTSTTGKVFVAVYNKEDCFLKMDKVFKYDGSDAKEGTTQVIIGDLPEGEYALAVFHDENDNGELDKNFIGIPKEDIGFSIGKMKTFGPPCFKECAFLVRSDSEITVRI